MSSVQIVIATNNGDIGGGEVMLLALAQQLRSIGVSVQIVGPATPSGVVDAARAAGYCTVVLDASGRSAYMIALRRWRRRHPEGVLWCNGLVPAVATALTAHRVVHLHQLPAGILSVLAKLARRGALATVVPSRAMSSRLKGTLVLENWVEEVHPARLPRRDDVIRLGFLGRPSIDKGVHVLALVVEELEARDPGTYRLVIAGEPRFVNEKSRQAVERALTPLRGMVHQVGWMPPDEFFGAVDVLVCPSVVPESFGLVVAEAMSARIPVIVSDAGALPEVAGSDHPWIVQAGNANALAAAIEAVSVLINDQSKRNTLDSILSLAHRRWSEKFSPDAGRERLRKVLIGSDVMDEE